MEARSPIQLGNVWVVFALALVLTKTLALVQLMVGFSNHS
jgi:hypothetical protein